MSCILYCILVKLPHRPFKGLDKVVSMIIIPSSEAGMDLEKKEFSAVIPRVITRSHPEHGS